MGALLPLEGKAPAVAKPAEKAVLGSSLETFLMTSILDTICLPLGGFSGAEQQREISAPKRLFSSQEAGTESSYPTLQHGEPQLAPASQAFQLFQG